VAVALALCLSGADSAASGEIPVYVSLSGSGTIRLRIADGVVMPCTAGSGNRVLFDGELTAGRSLVLSSEHCVCVEQTYGAFRKTSWGPARIVCNAPRGYRRVYPFIRVDLTTQRPLGG
jgi:hypothetical protein